MPTVPAHGIEARARQAVLAFVMRGTAIVRAVLHTECRGCRRALDSIAAGSRWTARGSHYFAPRRRLLRADLNFGERIEPISHGDNVARLQPRLTSVHARRQRPDPIHKKRRRTLEAVWQQSGGLAVAYWSAIRPARKHIQRLERARRRPRGDDRGHQRVALSASRSPRCTPTSQT